MRFFSCHCTVVMYSSVSWTVYNVLCAKRRNDCASTACYPTTLFTQQIEGRSHNDRFNKASDTCQLMTPSQGRIRLFARLWYPVNLVKFIRITKTEAACLKRVELKPSTHIRRCALIVFSDIQPSALLHRQVDLRSFRVTRGSRKQKSFVLLYWQFTRCSMQPPN